jgi:hypothetical protein
MPVTLTNLQRRGPLLVPLASGTTLRLSPGQTSAELPDVDVQHNPMIDKLRRQGLVEVTSAQAAAETAPAEKAPDEKAPDEKAPAEKAPAGKATAAKGQSRSKSGGAGDAPAPDGGGGT